MSHTNSLKKLSAALIFAFFSLAANAEQSKTLHTIKFTQKLPNKLFSVFWKNTYFREEPLPRAVYYNKLDLNNDKTGEYFIRITDPAWCGMHNCTILVFSKKGNHVRLLLDVSSGPEIYIRRNKTKGYHDISFYPAIESDKHIWRWDGKQYQ